MALWYESTEVRKHCGGSSSVGEDDKLQDTCFLMGVKVGIQAVRHCFMDFRMLRAEYDGSTSNMKTE